MKSLHNFISFTTLISLILFSAPVLAHEEDEVPTKIQPSPSETISKEELKAKNQAVEEALKAAKEAKTEERLAKLKVYGLKEIDRRISKLNELLERIQNSTKLEAADQAALVTHIHNQLDSLDAQKAKIEALTTDDVASKDAVKDSVRKHPIFSVIEPKLRGLEVSHTSSQILQRVKNLEAKLDRFLAKAKEAGQDTSGLESQITTFKNHLNQAEALVTTAYSEFRQMNPSDPAAAKVHLEAGKKALKSAKADLAAAKDLLHTITEELRKLENHDDED